MFAQYVLIELGLHLVHAFSNRAYDMLNRFFAPKGLLYSASKFLCSSGVVCCHAQTGSFCFDYGGCDSPVDLGSLTENPENDRFQK